uniref:Epidermal growth factor receptor substrate 15-like 1 n=1 Tax=Anopheles epiroticus TaxID=199890 RepID=A0A182PFS9_9DIPT
MPDIIKIAGDHILIYEAYYKQLDPKELNEIGALDAAKFLKKSGLSDVVLSRIWDLSDPNGKGFLTKEGFFVSLKLIGLAQEGSEINLKNIYNVLSKPPKVGDLPKVPAQVKLLPVESTDWSMKPEKRQQYEQLFDSLGPMNGLLPGAKVRMTLMNSKLPVETLGRIWDLADQDRDGSLDKHEFCVAMHLVYEALDKRAIPAVLPPQLQRNYSAPPGQNGGGFDAFGSGGDGGGGFVANFPSDIAPPPVVPPLPAALARPPPITGVVAPAIPPVPMAPLISTSAPIEVTSWVVSPLERCKYEEIFNKSDTDRDGLVSGLEIKDVFLQSGVAQNKLAHIWALCDSNQSGKLKLEEFCLAMWFVDRAKKGIDPPQALAPNMVPPSLRKSSLIQAQEPPQPTYSNPELEMISKEIDELAKERRLLEQEVAQKEADVRIKSGELRSLQSELDTLTATLKQLENQKGEAQKRLDDLKNQVTKIREQCQKQEATLKEQEGELDSRRSELQKLRDEEQSLEKEYNASTKEVDRLTSQLQDTHLEISQVQAMVTQIQEYQRQMTDALSMFRSAIESNDPILVSDYSLKIEPEFREAKQALEEKEVENANKRDPFGDNRANGFSAGEAETGFGDDFKSNGFNAQFDVGSNGGFHGSVGGFGDDGFGAFGAKTTGGAADPFASAGAAADPFGDRKGSAAAEPTKDEFGCDPFAILHAPTTAGQALTPSPSKSVAPPRPESPSPALPPKKAKQPPPRPAPPRPMQGPTPTKPAPPASDAFGDSSGGGSFANFADFDNKNLKPVTSQTLQASSSSFASSGTAFGSNRSLTGSSVSSSTILPPMPPVATITVEPATPPVPAARVTPVAQLSAAPTPTPVADFADDPFKDYRYEDPFNIEDPFADAEDDAAPPPVNDPFASLTIMNNNNPLANSFDAKFSQSANASVEELDELFKGVRILGDGANDTPSPVALNNSQSSRLNNNTLSSLGKTTKLPFGSDPFDAFNDNFSKNTNQTDDSLFSAFGNSGGGDGDVSEKSTDLFDAFRATTTSPAVPPTAGDGPAASSTSAMMKSFEDEFSKMDAANVLNNNLSTTSTTFAGGNEFDAKFDDAFSAFNHSNASSTADSNKFGGSAFGATLPPPVKHLKPTSRNGTSSATGSLKRPDGSADPPKLVERFNADYSKGETFDADLEAVLQRSLVEK